MYTQELKKFVQSIIDNDFVGVRETLPEIFNLLKELESDLGTEIEDLKDRIWELEDDNEEVYSNEIDTGRDTIGYKIAKDNLLDTQIMDAFADIMENPKTNHLTFLQLLKNINKAA